MSADLPTSGRIERGEHLLPTRVYYEDTDFSGRVYHARYLQFLERGRSDFLRVLGVVHAELLALPDPISFAVARMTIAFKAAASIDDALIVATRFTSAKGARLVLEQEVRRDGLTLVAAEVEAVCVGPEGRPRRPPKALAAAIKALVPSTAVAD
jgi:acyl-CoA thioester hydrolase